VGISGPDPFHRVPRRSRDLSPQGWCIPPTPDSFSFLRLRVRRILLKISFVFALTRSAKEKIFSFHFSGLFFDPCNAGHKHPHLVHVPSPFFPLFRVVIRVPRTKHCRLRILVPFLFSPLPARGPRKRLFFPQALAGLVAGIQILMSRTSLIISSLLFPFPLR